MRVDDFDNGVVGELCHVVAYCVGIVGFLPVRLLYVYVLTGACYCSFMWLV